jgi:diaphanous 1
VFIDLKKRSIPAETVRYRWKRWLRRCSHCNHRRPEDFGVVGDKGRIEKGHTARWYVDGIRAGRSTDIKLVKHLISLRVHLSTAKLVWIEEFVDAEKGLDALRILLADLVGKGGKRKILVDVESTVLLEVVKCLRVLLNTEVSGSCLF